MNLDELDAQLAYWTEANKTILANVYELYEQPTYRTLALALDGASPSITGITAQRAKNALAAVKDLLVLSLELDTVVKRSVALRGSLPILFQTAPIAEIEELLAGASINLSETQTPLSERGLLSQTRQARALTPRQLLDLMLPAFESAKSVILEIDEAWTRLPAALEDQEKALHSLQEAVTAQGLGEEFHFEDLRRRLGAARAQIMTDPLGGSVDAQSALEKDIQEARQRLETRLQDRRKVVNSLAAAGELLRQARESHEQAKARREECLLKVETSGAAPLPATASAARIEKLADWHGKLQAAVERGEWQPARVGLENWRAAAQETMALDAASLLASEELLNCRKELRGRLEALQAKASSRGCAEDSTLGKIAREAAALFARRPSPLPEIERLLSDYQKTLTERVQPRPARQPG